MDQELVQCGHLGLGLTLSEDNEVVVLVTVGETVSTHCVAMPLEQAVNITNALMGLIFEGTRLRQEFEGLPPDKLAAAVEEVHRRFSARLN